MKNTSAVMRLAMLGLAWFTLLASNTLPDMPSDKPSTSPLLGPLVEPPGSDVTPTPQHGRHLFHPVPANADYLIVTDAPLTGAFERFAAWKRRYGVSARVRTLTSIRRQFPSALDDAERIRLAIRDAYAHGTRWVLLGGDTEVIPTRTVHSPLYAQLGLPPDFPSDFYFACLDGTWNADGDAFYGEREDSVDVTPEVMVGRAPARTPEEARVFVDKTIDYSEGRAVPASRQTLFFAEVLVPDDWPGPPALVFADLAALVEDAMSDVLTAPGFDPVRLYENYTNPQYPPGALPETKKSVLDHLTRGYPLSVFAGRGSAQVMSVGSERLEIGDVLGLENRRRLTNLFSFSSQTHDIREDCIGEAFLRAPRGGAVSSIGPSAVTFTGQSTLFMKNYLRLAFEEGVETVGELANESRSEFSSLELELSTILLGDPQVRLTPEPRSCPRRSLASEDDATAEIAKGAEGIREAIMSSAPWPNPTRGPITIDIDLVGSSPRSVDVAVFDLAGRRVRSLENGMSAGGRLATRWDLRDGAGRRVDPGVYFLSVQFGPAKRVWRLLVVD